MDTTLDKRELRDVLGKFTTGVTVVTTIDSAGKQYGVTANSFSSVSLDPPLILWSQSLSSSSAPAFQEAERFAVNILSTDQISISNRFAKSGDDKFVNVDTAQGLGDVPIIKGCSAHLECVKVDSFPGGDHVVYIGRVERIFRSTEAPLAFAEGRYMATYAYDLGVLDGNMDHLPHTEAVRFACAALPEIGKQTGLTVSLGVWGNKGPTIIRWEPSLNPISENLRTGVVLTATRSTTGLAFLAFLPETMTAEIINEEIKSGEISQALLDTQLQEVRQHRMARAAIAKESPLHQVRINAFSCPIFDSSGSIIFALTVSARSNILAPDWDGPVPVALKKSAETLSRRMGCTVFA